MRKLICAALAVVAVNAFAADKAIVDRYNKTCVACHASGAAGAPKFGVAADWAPRLAKGQDKLMASIKTASTPCQPKACAWIVAMPITRR